MGAKKLSEPSAGTKAKGDDEVLRYGTAKDWRATSSTSSKKSDKKVTGSQRNNTAKDWRKGAAKKTTEKSASRKRKTEKLRGGLSRD